MYKESAKGWLKHLDFMILDLVVMFISLLLSFLITWGNAHIFTDRRLSTIFLIFIFCVLITIFFTQPFKDILKRGSLIEFGQTLKHAAIIIVMFLVGIFILHQQGMISRTFIVLISVFYTGLTYFSRLLWKKLLMGRFRKGTKKQAMLLITCARYAKEAVQNLTASDLYDFFLCGIVLVDRNEAGKTIGGIPVLENTESVLSEISRDWVDEIFIYLPEELKLSEKSQNALESMGVTVHRCLAKVNDNSLYEQNMQQIGCYAVITGGMRIVSTTDVFYKRILDVIGGLIGCAATGIIFLFVAPMILKQSPGAPVIFSQVRIGRNGKPFKIYKFRSMYPDAEERKAALLEQTKTDDGIMFKMDEDPRIISSGKRDKRGNPKGIGYFIRRTSLDEFPQFWNVLKGDMSLVGTRPPTVDEWERYDIHHRARMRVKPGITDMWQVSGRSEIVDMEEVLRLDLEYIQNWSVSLDIKILFKTVYQILFNRSNAY